MTIANAKRRATRMPVLLEADIQRTICDFLRVEGWRVFEFESSFNARKMRWVGEKFMPDVLAIRYSSQLGRLWASCSQVLWIELKRVDKRGRTTKASEGQKDWHRDERARGALTVIAGEDFPASIEGFMDWYTNSGLRRAQ